MFTKLLLACTVLTALVILPSGAAAGDNASRFDFDFGGGAAYVSLPKVNGFATDINTDFGDFVRQFDGTPALEGWGPAVGAHFGSPDFDGGFFSGARFDADITGVWASATPSPPIHLADRPYPAFSDFLAEIPINGGINPAAISFPGTSPNQQVDMSFWQIDGALTLERPVAVVNGTELSILAGPRLAYQEQDYQATITGSALGTNLEYSLDEDVAAFFGGPEIGFRSLMRLPGGGDFHVTGRAAAVWYDAQLDAHQRFTGFVGGVVHDDLSLHDTDDNVGARLELASGVAVPIPNTRFVFTVDGSFVWWSAVPQVVNPRSGPGYNHFTDAPSPARLGSDDMFVASLMARIKIALP
jgi:hypothetical protein